jgi:TetR/AcrR family transcriptional repressor of nem operon
LSAICDGDDERLDDAIALMTVCVGGMALARAVSDPKFSARILRVARETAAKLADTQPN